MEMKETFEPFNHNDSLDYVTTTNFTTHLTLDNVTYAPCISTDQRTGVNNLPFVEMEEILKPFEHNQEPLTAKETASLSERKRPTY